MLTLLRHRCQLTAIRRLRRHAARCHCFHFGFHAIDYAAIIARDIIAIFSLASWLSPLADYFRLRFQPILLILPLR
jgi:hypothetical protein